MAGTRARAAFKPTRVVRNGTARNKGLQKRESACANEQLDVPLKYDSSAIFERGSGHQTSHSDHTFRRFVRVMRESACENIKIKIYLVSYSMFGLCETGDFCNRRVETPKSVGKIMKCVF